MYQVYKPQKYHQIPPRIAPSRSFRQQDGIQVRVEKVDNHRTSSSCIWWSLMMSPRSWQAPLVLEVHSAQLVGKGNDWQVRGWTCGFDSFPPSVAPARRWLMDSMAMTPSKSIIATGPMQQFLWRISFFEAADGRRYRNFRKKHWILISRERYWGSLILSPFHTSSEVRQERSRCSLPSRSEWFCSVEEGYFEDEWSQMLSLLFQTLLVLEGELGGVCWAHTNSEKDTPEVWRWELPIPSVFGFWSFCVWWDFHD